MITDILSSYDYAKASTDLQNKLSVEVAGLAGLVMETARSNVRYYPDVRNHLERHIIILANEMINADITADFWQAWLEQFGKGSQMAGTDQNPGLITYINSEAWNRMRSRSSRVVVGRPAGTYKSIDGTTRISKGGYAGVDLEELAQRRDIDKSFGPSPPTYFMWVALQSNKNRILQGISRVIEEFPYHKYFK